MKSNYQDEHDEKSEANIQKNKDSNSSLKKGISRLIFTPAVFTVLITALIGPFSIGLVNNFVKNKEIDIERKKQFIAIQKDMLNRVLEYTNGSDFNTINSIEKIEIMAKMLDENREIFALQFSNTVATIDNLYKDKYKAFAATKQQEIALLQQRKSQDSLTLKGLIREKDQLIAGKGLKEYEIQAKYEAGVINLKEMNKQRQALADSIERKEGQISGLNQSIDLTSKKIDDVNRENYNLLNQMRMKDEQYQISVRDYKQTIVNDSLLIGEKESNIAKLTLALEDSKNSLTQALAIIDELRKNGTVPDQKMSPPQPVSDSSKKAASVALSTKNEQLARQ